MDLQNEVKLDFAGSAQLAANMRLAAEQAARFRREMAASNRDISAALRLRGQPAGPGGPATGGPSANPATAANRAQAADRAALFGTAAVGSGLFYRSTSLANPAAMQRFQDAIDDTTAVIGHRLIPALEMMTRYVRQFGDFLARNPEVAKGVGYGALGLTGLAAAGSLYGIGRMAVRGGIGAYTDIAGLFGRGAAAAAPAAAGESALATVGTEAALTAAAASRGGRLGRLGGRLGRIGGRIAVPAAIAYEGYSAYEDYQNNQIGSGMLERQGRGMGVPGLGREDQSYIRQAGEWLYRKVSGTSKEEFDKRMAPMYATDAWWNPFYDPDKARQMGAQPFAGYKGPPSSQGGGESFGAATRPVQYSDVLQSVLGMRQEIATGGVDPATRTANASERTADATEKIAESSGGLPDWLKTGATFLGAGIPAAVLDAALKPSARSTGADR